MCAGIQIRLAGIMLFLGKTIHPRVQTDDGKLVRVHDKMLLITIFAVLFTFELKYLAIEWESLKGILWLENWIAEIYDARLRTCPWALPIFLVGKTPQCTDKYSKKIFSIAIFLPHVLRDRKRQISLPVGYKTTRPKTGDWERLWCHFRTPSLAKNRFLQHFLIFL